MRKDETLYSIARRYNVRWPEIMRHNSCSPLDLQPGQVLLIPIPAGRSTAEWSNRAGRDSSSQSRLALVRTVSMRDLHRGRPSSAYWWPTAGKLGRGYGESVRGFKEPGVGIPTPAGTPVHAVADGTVVCCVRALQSDGHGWGNVVAIRHADGIVSWYGQLRGFTVRKGRGVSRGEQIGTAGSSGAARRSELALRFFKDERPVDPTHYLP